MQFVKQIHLVEPFLRLVWIFGDAMVMLISGAIRLFGSLLYIPAIRYFSRRGLLCISSFLMGVSLILLGLAVYSHHSKDSALRHDYSNLGRNGL